MKLAGEVVPATFLVAGFRRREALRKFRADNPKGFDKKFPNGIPAIIRTGELQDILCLHLRENIARVNPAAEDIIPVLLRLQDEFKMKQNVIAAQVGKSTAWVSQILTVKKTLGKEGIEELEKGGISLKDAKDASAKVQAAAKKGVKLDAKEELQKAKDKTSARKESGRERDEKRMSAKKVFAIYKAMPSVTMGERIQLLEKALGYLAGAEDSLPKAFKLDSERASKVKK
jgi:ParB-like chromosome segregation protein Spo0J